MDFLPRLSQKGWSNSPVLMQQVTATRFPPGSVGARLFCHALQALAQEAQEGVCTRCLSPLSDVLPLRSPLPPCSVWCFYLEDSVSVNTHARAHTYTQQTNKTMLLASASLRPSHFKSQPSHVTHDGRKIHPLGTEAVPTLIMDSVL